MADRDAAEPKGWYSRGYLPHLDAPGLCQSITFRLHDSVPLEIVQRWKEELQWHADLPAESAVVAELRRRIVANEDAGHGACWLKDERIANLVQAALFHFDGVRYSLLAWCVMPNHVHVLVKSFPGHPLHTVLHSWKSFTANKANTLLARDGIFWSRDYYDRYIRDDSHLARTITYIEQNPVQCGFVKSAAEWRFSSASHRQ
jgi:REP element-mobilizing transposase RayT